MILNKEKIKNSTFFKKAQKLIMRNTYIVAFVAYVSIGLAIFWKLPRTFFQQDEWAILGYYSYWDKAHLNWLERFTHEQYTHIIPFSNYFSYLEEKFFGIEFAPYAFFSIFVHIINSFLVYFLAEKLIRKKSIAFLAGLFFLVNSITHQAITWIATTMGTAGATFFALLSLIFFVKYSLNDNKKTVSLFFSILCLLLAIGFKETVLPLFLFFPVFWVFCKKEKTLKNSFFTFLPFLLLGIFYLIVRFILSIVNVSTQLPGGLIQPAFFTYFFRLLSLPLKAVSQSFIPTDIIIKISDRLVLLGYPQFATNNVPNPYISQAIGADIVSYIFSIMIFFACILMYSFFKKQKKDFFSNTILIALAFIALSSFPLILIPGTAGYFSLFDGRHLYLTSIFSSILLAVLLYGFYSFFVKKLYAKIIITFLAIALVIFNSVRIRGDINQLAGTALIRKSILSKTFSLHPVLFEKTVFYVEGDTAYYGLPASEKIVPFQSGFGQTLLVWYNFHGQKYPACFFKGEYLYELLSEGYKECEGRGFGYFRKRESLQKAIEQYNISLGNIIGLKYNSSAHVLSPMQFSKSDFE